MAKVSEVIAAGGWQLRRPKAESLGRRICIPTVHPMGDGRVLRCAQSALDSGYAVHFIWMGGRPATNSVDPLVLETCLPEATSFLDRVRALPRIARLAAASDASAWHIHDFYMLPFALVWNIRTRRPVIYDVHEYYPIYYAAKLRLPGRLVLVAEGLISHFQTWTAARLGGVNVVSETMAVPFRAAGVPCSVTPNYPLLRTFGPPSCPPEPLRLRRIVHTGTLTDDYGSHLLVDIAVSLESRGADVEVFALARFPSDSARRSFEAYRSARAPKNLTMVEPMPAHELPAFLATCGIGLSMLQAGGQNELAVAAKLYEYTILGLAVVASDLPGQRAFLSAHSSARLVVPDDPADYALAVMELISHQEETCAEVEACAARARVELTWEGASSPNLEALLLSVIG